MESAEQPVVTEAPKTVEFSLKNYASQEIPSFNQALQRVGINTRASIVFGSAVHPSEVSASTKVNPTRWDVDVLEIVDSIASLREKPSQVIQTDSGRRYGCIVAPSGGLLSYKKLGQ